MRFWDCHRWATVCLTIAFAFTGPFSENRAHAQKPKADSAKDSKTAKNEGAQPGVGMEIAKVEGKWDAFSQGIIKILNAENQELFLLSENDTVVRYTAEADPAWLMPGYMVRFSASFDQNAKPTAPLKAIEVFTPNTRRRLSPQDMREQTPGIHLEVKESAEEPQALLGDKNKKPQQPKAKPAKKEAITPGQTFRVVGQIGGIKNNVLTIVTSQPIQIEVDPTAVVTVTANDLASASNLITKGDSVSVSGLRSPAQPTQIYCEQITIKASKKLTQAMPQAKKGKTSARDNDAKNSKDAKDKPEPKKPNSADKKPQ